MTEWMAVRQLYRGCTRAQVLRALVLQRLGSLSGAVAVGFVLLALLALVMASVFFTGYWLALALPVVVLAFGLLGALVVEDRLHTVFDELTADDWDVLAVFRRGFLGVRYLLFRKRLQDAGRFHPAMLETALRCCDAERELAGAARPRVRRAPVIGLVLLAMALAGVAPWLAGYGVDPLLLRLPAAGLSFLAMLLLSLVVAQSGGQPLDELRCLLAWALEDARASVRNG